MHGRLQRDKLWSTWIPFDSGRLAGSCVVSVSGPRDRGPGAYSCCLREFRS